MHPPPGPFLACSCIYFLLPATALLLSFSIFSLLFFVHPCFSFNVVQLQPRHKIFSDDDPRLGSIVKGALLSDFKVGDDQQKADASAVAFRVGIVGFPFDEGTIRNGGRKGGKLGPKNFRDAGAYV